MVNSIISVPVLDRDSAYARDILSKTSSTDIGQEIVPCTLKMRIESAFFKEQRLSNGLHRPYMEINGKVKEMFIEQSGKDNGRLFMCGSPSITVIEDETKGGRKDGLPLTVNYILSTNELVNLINKGMLFDDFEMPPELIGGILEIPGNVVYTCVYDTPITAVSVYKAWEIETSTKVNHYDTLFEMWQVSPKRALEEHINFVYSFDSFAPPLMPAPESALTDYWDDDLPKEPRAEYIPERETDTEEAFIKDFENTTIKQSEADTIRKREEVAKNAAQRKATIIAIRKAHDDETERKKRQAAADQDLYAQLSGRTTTDDSEGNSAKMGYDDLVKALAEAEANAAANVAQKIAHSDGSTYFGDGDSSETSTAISRLMDVVQDNQALNAGNRNIAGHGADTTQDTSQMSTAEKAKLHEEESRKKGQIVDRALDNQALNEGNTDIAGQGASHTMTQAEKVAAAGNALRGLLGRKSPTNAVPSSNPANGSEDDKGYI